MSNMDAFRLCGGTFFVLISNARKPMPSKDEFYKGVISGLSEPEALMGLAKVLIPDISKPMKTEEKSLKDNTRDFKACIRNGGTFFRLGDAAVLKTFDDRVKQQYKVPLKAMVDFVEEFLDVRTSTKKDEYLVKGLIELLNADNTIDGNELFYARKDGSTMTKDQILSAKELCLPSFLLGLWHYVLTVVKDNKVGQITYDMFCPKQGGAERTYTKMLGKNSTREITITYCAADEFTSSAWNEKECATEEANRDAESFASQKQSQDQLPPSGTTVNNNPFFLNITGGTNTVYGHVDKIEIKNGRSDVDE